MLFYDFEEMLEEDKTELMKLSASFAERFCLSGDAWANFLAFRLITDENAFSLSCEKGGGSGSVSKLVRGDIEKILPMFTSDYTLYMGEAGNIIRSYTVENEKLNAYTSRIKKLAYALSSIANAVDDWDEVDEVGNAVSEAIVTLREDYQKNGAGVFSQADAFRILDSKSPFGFSVMPVTNFMPKPLSSIVGYDSQKRALVENTRAFANGESRNNVLLYGDAGTGKSTSVKALAAEFKDKKLKIIEVYKHQYSLIGTLMSQLEQRGCRFILFLDDLSFEDTETEYKYFKAIIDGGLGSIPENVVIYATSNRMHLIKETFSDRSDISNDDIHRSDTVEEKISLSARFGLSLFYPAPDTKEYLNIVAELAAEKNIKMPPEQLNSLAIRWCAAQNKKSGRTAEQFIDALLSNTEE